MAELTSKKLNDSYKKHLAIKNLFHYSNNEINRRSHDSVFLSNIGFPYIGEKQKDIKGFVREKMDDISESIEEITIVGFISDFEKIIFDRLDNASGEAVKIVREKYDKPPFKDHIIEFVKTSKDIDKLSMIKAIISPRLSVDLAKHFSEVIEYRNRLAHGKRFGNESLLTFDDIAIILDKVLENV